MPLSIGDRLGPYEILAPLGKGGMGEVYKARDTKLDRDVAIKVLPAALARDPERLARFDREAKILASLNHPNIAQIHAIQEVAGTRALVMELVPGETLKRPLPLADALREGRQIADAVQAAHDKNIVHRDLKPANIMITQQGVVKVLDFGLAKLTEVAVSSGDPGESPTLTMAAATQAGTVMGTALYMAPEQARGQQDVDRRADIWAFGVVLYEMLTGKHPFRGGTISDILASVLKVEPDFEPVPLKMRPLLRSCLQKEPRERLQAIGDWELLLQDAPAPAPQAASGKLPWMIAAAVLAAVAAGASWMAWRATQPANPAAGATSADLAFSIVPAAGGLMAVGELHATPEISPDGSAVIFYGVEDGAVYLRQLNKLTPEPVRKSGIANPGFWSPDSRTFVFSDGTNLKKMRVPDGAPETVSNDAAVLLGGSLSDNGTLLFAAVKSTSELYAVPASGGGATQVEVTGLTEKGSLVYPEFLPGSEEFLFLSQFRAGGIEDSEIYLATLRDGRATDPVPLMKNATAARYTPAGGGRILFVQNDNLYARTLNRAARKLEGEPELIQRNVASSPAFGRAHFSVSRTGVVAWRPGTAGLSQVTIFDRQGKEIGTAGSPTVVQTLRLAPEDETHLLLGFNFAAWLLEPNRPGQQKVAQGTRETIFSTDGSKFLDAIPFGAKVQTVVERPVTGEGAPRELAKPPGLGRLEDISPDGKTLLFSRGALDTAVFAFQLDGSAKEPRNLVPTSSETISHARFSPDGRWIMYGAREGKIYAGGGIYVQPFPTGLRKQLTNRGNYPVWRKDGKEIVYLDEYKGRNYIWSVPITGAGGEIRAGAPTPLFPARSPATTFGDLNFLAVSKDGSRFYIPQAVEQPDSGVIHVRMGALK